MYVRKCGKTVKGKTYTNYILVESVMTPKGPRQKTVCSLGNLKPRPREEWLALARKIEDALIGQEPLFGDDPDALKIAAKVRSRQKKQEAPLPLEKEPEGEVVAIKVDEVTVEKSRQAGTVHVGLSFYDRLGIDEELADCGLSERARRVSKAMVMNRLIFPQAEHAMPEWVGSTALPDLVGEDLEEVHESSLYRNLDRLYPNRERIERGLAKRAQTLFDLDDTVYLYDLTSTYFEGQCLENPKAKRGYSRDKRPDCKQVVVGLVVDRQGFPKAHEVFEGNRTDSTTVNEMLEALQRRVGHKPGGMVVVDRGMAYAHNLEEIARHGFDYLVASRQEEREEWLEEFEKEEGWKAVQRIPSPNNSFQRKSRIEIRQMERGEESVVLCLSEERKAKDRGIRNKKEKRLLEDLKKLSKRIAKGRLKQPKKIHEAIGRLKERHPRVARYYDIEYDEELSELEWDEDEGKKKKAARLDGGYLLKTNRKELEDEEIWKIYSLLTRVENAFRSMKSPLAERPIFHHLEHRVDTHIFLCVLAYHLLVAIETTLRNEGIYTSWDTVRTTLSTHHVATVVLPTADGDTLRIRKANTPDPEVRNLYTLLGVPLQIMKPVKSRMRGEHST